MFCVPVFVAWFAFVRDFYSRPALAGTEKRAIGERPGYHTLTTWAKQIEYIQADVRESSKRALSISSVPLGLDPAFAWS